MTDVEEIVLVIMSGEVVALLTHAARNNVQDINMNLSNMDIYFLNFNININIY